MSEQEKLDKIETIVLDMYGSVCLAEGCFNSDVPKTSDELRHSGIAFARIMKEVYCKISEILRS